MYRTALLGLKAIYSGQIIEDIKLDLACGSVTMDTVEKRVQLYLETGKAIIELLNPNPIWGIFLELIITEQTNALRTNLKNQILWLNDGQGLDGK